MSAERLRPPDPSGSRTPLDDAGLEALEAALDRRFRLVETVMRLGGEPLTLIHPASADDLITEDDFIRDERLPYWADVWPSAHVLAERVRALDGTGRTLLELGCGSGLVASAAARAGFAVTATDYYEDALDMAAVNAWRACGHAIRTRHVDWRALPDDLGHFDLVVASDVLYEREYAQLVARTIRLTLARGGEAIVADPGRVAAPDFLREAAALGLGVWLADRVSFDTGMARQNIDLHGLRRV